MKNSEKRKDMHFTWNLMERYQKIWKDFTEAATRQRQDKSGES